jgi:hypothetical protein
MIKENMDGSLKTFFTKYKYIVYLFLVWFFVLSFIAVLSNIWLPDNELTYATNSAFDVHKISNAWTAWDSVYYYSIAAKGYRAKIAMFFPLYPGLIAILGKLTKEYVLGGLLVSWVSIFVGLIYFYKLLKLDYEEKVARRTLLYLLLFPTAFFFLSYYTEALFFMLSVMSFYFARTNRWWLAGIFGFFTALTRLVGIALFPILLLEYLVRREFSMKKIKTDILSALLIPAGLFIYMVYLYYKFGNILAFKTAYQLGWTERANLEPNLFLTLARGILRLVNSFLAITKGLLVEPYLHDFIFLSFMFLAIVLIAIGYKFYKIRLSYLLYGSLLIAIPLLSGVFESMNRYVLVIFPVFIVLGLMGKNKIFGRIYILVSSSALIFSLIAFANKYWVG